MVPRLWFLGAGHQALSQTDCGRESLLVLYLQAAQSLSSAAKSHVETWQIQTSWPLLEAIAHIWDSGKTAIGLLTILPLASSDLCC